MGEEIDSWPILNLEEWEQLHEKLALHVAISELQRFFRERLGMEVRFYIGTPEDMEAYMAHLMPEKTSVAVEDQTADCVFSAILQALLRHHLLS
jgi:hypothetical protein